MVGLTHFDGCCIHQGLNDMMSLMDKRVTALTASTGDERSLWYALSLITEVSILVLMIEL